MDVFPEFAQPYVKVQTEVPGLSTAEVEALLIVPIENALTGSIFAAMCLEQGSGSLRLTHDKENYCEVLS